MKVLGLDLSTVSTGYCVIDTNKILTYGVIRPPSNKDFIDRIIFIEKEIKELIKAKSVEYVCIEELSSMRSASTTKKLAALQGHIEIQLRKKDILVVTVRPSEWRKNKIKGRKREELKNNAIKYVKDKYDLIVNDDEADAICIAEFGSEIDIEEE